ncbi:PREDICTED: uncharacterized protein LOC107336482, partial [Paramuricea clavata]
MSKQTIPRLELLSSLLAPRLTDSVKKALNDVKRIDSVTYWSDSTVVLSWIRNSNKEFKQFVENRLLEIRRLGPPKLWKTIGRLLRVTAYVLRFINNLKKRVENLDTTVDQITCEEIDSAELKWIKDIQHPMSKQANYRKVKESLNLFEGKGNIIRCHGRIQESRLPYDKKFPILLPSDHYFTRLVVLRSHEQVMHNGDRETLTQVRSKYWITKGRQVVKKILSKCTICRRLEGPPYGNPEAPPLPEFRLSNDFAFSKIAVDYAGRMYVKDIYSQSKDMYKVYISLYTCSSSRALHLDLVPDMSSEAFVRSLERFIGRRGIPALIISNNGKTFK